jgi:hypothetical protein
MSSKKPPSDKRATLPRAADYTKSFSKDWTRLTHSGRFNLKQLKEAMLLLIANDGPLGPEWLAAADGQATDRRQLWTSLDSLDTVATSRLSAVSIGLRPLPLVTGGRPMTFGGNNQPAKRILPVMFEVQA